MRLNATALNRRRLNGGRRVPVLWGGRVLTGLMVGMKATRVTHGAGVAEHQLLGDFRASAIRNATGTWTHRIDADLAQTVARNGSGKAELSLSADLFYSRVVLGTGAAALELQLLGHVGVVFIDGQAIVRPMQAELNAAKRVQGAGVIPLGFGGELSPSAVRRVAAGAPTVTLDGALEASHIDAQGVRHLGFSGAVPLQLAARDAGMVRQTFIGSLDFDLQGIGSGALTKPTLAGAARLNLEVVGTFHVLRRTEGQALLGLGAIGEGAVLVQGEGRAVVALLASAAGYKRTYPGLQATVLSMIGRLDGTRVVGSGGACTSQLAAFGDGTRRRLGKGTAVLEVLGESDGYLNPDAEDPAEETFLRPALLRDFQRPATVREWRR